MEQNEQNAAETQSEQPKKSKKKIGCWIAGCLTAMLVGIMFVAAIIGLAFWATGGTVKVIEEQLAYLREGDIESAYELTAGNFRKATDLPQFKQFISSNSYLAQNESASFTSRKVENNIGYVEGTLTAIDGSRSPVKYELIKEKGEWRILYIELSRSGTKPSPPEAQETPVSEGTLIEEIEIGTQRGANGTILDPGTSLPEGVGEIKVSAYVSNVKKGQRVSAVWHFAGEKITEPVVNIIMEDGDFISQFSISPPDNGWPTGNYKVVVSMDKGKVSKETSYSIGL